MPEKMTRINVTIPPDDYAWLQGHPEINVSGLVQKCITEMRQKFKG